MSTKEQIKQLLSLANITINGKKATDIQVYDERFYKKVLSGGTLALGEMYMDQWWDVKSLDGFFTKLLTAKEDTKIKRYDLVKLGLKSIFFNLQTKSRAKIVGERHYDIGNDLYKTMLDSRMVYSCGYWKNAKTLETAQEAKLDLVCRKLGLKKGM